MGRKKRKPPRLSKWLYNEKSENNPISGKFLMLPPELFKEPAFQNLSHAARTFYILLNVHKQTKIQRQCLYNALLEYNAIFDIGYTEFDILQEAEPDGKTKYTSGFVVIPEKHLKMYGYNSQYAYKLKNELINAGFIKVAYGGKGKSRGWDKNVTVYQFSNEWKSKSS